MAQSPAQRYKSLALQTNHMFAHAVIYGDMTREEASTFGVWVSREKLNHETPADALALYWSDGDQRASR